MDFNKKVLTTILLVGVFTHIGAMKRKPEDDPSPNKRQKTEVLDPSEALTKHTHTPMLGNVTNSPAALRYQAKIEIQQRKNAIKRAIENNQFDATKGLLSAYSAYVDHDIMDQVFNANFSEERLISLYRQLQNDGVANVCGFIDLGSGKNILHIFAEKNYSDLFYKVLLDCPNAQELIKAEDDEGNTVIHLTSHPAIIASAIKLGVDIDEQNKKGNTALHETAGNSAAEKQKAAILLRYSASLDILNQMGLTPHENGGGRNEALNPEEKTLIARETVKGISFGSQKQNMTSHILDRSAGLKVQPGAMYNHIQSFWNSSESSEDNYTGSYSGSEDDSGE